MTRIIGIDPGSRITGYGIIDVNGNHNAYVSSGCVHVDGNTIADRLKIIFNEISQIVSDHQPHEMAIEQVFMHRNPDSALKLGQARGAAICACVNHELPVSEYSAREIKQATVGKGAAQKEQVQHMVKVLLALSDIPQADAADALAVALCHAHKRHALMNFENGQKIVDGRVRIT